MTSGYRHITLDQATPGMALSDNVLDAHGQVLLAKGLILTETILASLRRHQITILPIAATADPETAQQSDPEQIELRLAQLFRRKSSEDDATGLLEQHVRHYRLGDLS